MIYEKLKSQICLQKRLLYCQFSTPLFTVGLIGTPFTPPLDLKFCTNMVNAVDYMNYFEIQNTKFKKFKPWLVKGSCDCLNSVQKIKFANFKCQHLLIQPDGVKFLALIHLVVSALNVSL